MGVGFLFAPNHQWNMLLDHVESLVFAVSLWPAYESGWCKTFCDWGILLCRPIAEVMKQLGAEHVIIQEMGLMKLALQLLQPLQRRWNYWMDTYPWRCRDWTLNGLVVADAAASLKLINWVKIKLILVKKQQIWLRRRRNLCGGYYQNLCSGCYQDIIYGGQALEKMSVLAAKH